MPHLTDKAINPGYHSHRNLVAWLLLTALMLFAAMAGPFFVGRIYCRNDLGAYHLPVRDFYARQLAQGEAFDWMPQIFSGYYVTGDGQAGTYHPLHLLLYRVLPLRAAMGWELLISYPFMFAGTWLFLRRLILSTAAALFGSVIFTFSSFNLLHFIHPNAVAVVAHIPWLLWSIDIVLKDALRNKVYSALSAIALLTGSQLLLGYPQFVWFSLLTELVYAIYVLIIRRHIPRQNCGPVFPCHDCVGCYTSTWPDIFMAKCIGVFIGGVQLLPTIDALLHSARQSAHAAFALTGSMHPLNLLQLVAPYLFVDRVVGQNTHELGLYLGAVPLMLIVWLIVEWRELGMLKYLAWPTFLFAAMALLLAFGQYGHVYRSLTYLPLVGQFRFPARFIVVFQLAATILAAIGFLLLLQRNRFERRQKQTAEAFHYARKQNAFNWRQLEFIWLLAAISMAVALTGICFDKQPYIASLPLVLVGPAIFIVAALLVSWTARGSFKALVGLILLTALDLGAYGLSYSVYPYCPRLADFVANIPTPQKNVDGRVVASLYRFEEPGLRTGDQIVLRGWPRADGYAGLEPEQLLDYHQLPALRVAGVRWVLRGPTTNEIQGLVPRDDKWLEVPDPLPRVRLVAQTIQSDHPAADIAKIDITSQALTEVPLVFPAAPPGNAVLVEDLPGRIIIQTHSQSPQLLLIAESYHPGWKATINGRTCQTFRVNGDYIGCVVQSGTQLVTLEFQPSSLRAGRIISCVGLGFLPFCFIGMWIKPRF